MVRCSLLPMPPPLGLVRITREKQNFPRVDRKTRTPPLAICMVNEGVETLSREPGAQLLPPENSDTQSSGSPNVRQPQTGLSSPFLPLLRGGDHDSVTWSPRIGNSAHAIQDAVDDDPVELKYLKDKDVIVGVIDV